MVSDILEQSFGSICKIQAVKEGCWEQAVRYCAGGHVSCDCFSGTVRDCLTLQDGLDKLSLNMGNQPQTYAE